MFKGLDEVLRQPTLRRAVLGQAAYPFDEEVFVKIITNSAFSSYAHLVAVAIKPDDGRLPPLLDVFKLIISVQDIYDARLREEDIQTPVAPAKEIAYDAGWKPALADTTGSDGEEYRGRVKLPIECLDTWFYAARYEGVRLKDMRLKAQTHRSKWLICYSNLMENWNHESYI
ncbi:hypothetical protein K456DRAFT_1724512 [Colletotrichum gloeosporioides 23]|nr:hypothetical protein K456DRAFT_1724512 [Colletotrichum gloeosporioides 23]